jgi:glycine C-acetyltransferase
MDGDVAPLDRIVKIARESKAMLVVDDAHGEGVLGEHGKGVVDAFGVREFVTAEVGTLSKAFGVVGGYVCGSASVVELCRKSGRPYLFSTGLSPADTAAAMAAVEALSASDERVQRLWQNTHWFRARLEEYGFEITGQTPIVPVILGSEQQAQRIAREMFEAGVFVVAITYPMVSRGRARVRAMLSAEHTPEDLEFAAQALVNAIREAS